MLSQKRRFFAIFALLLLLVAISSLEASISSYTYRLDSDYNNVRSMYNSDPFFYASARARWIRGNGRDIRDTVQTNIDSHSTYKLEANSIWRYGTTERDDPQESHTYRVRTSVRGQFLRRATETHHMARALGIGTWQQVEWSGSR